MRYINVLRVFHAILNQGSPTYVHVLLFLLVFG
jgi:hypothetical protein